MSAQATALYDRDDLDGVLHDLRQPLAGIRALASAPLPDASEDEVPDELHERLRRIGELGDWMNELLCGGPPMETASTGAPSADAARVVQDVLLAAAPSFRGSLRWSLAGSAPVPMEPGRLRRAVGNIVDNATRAAGPGGLVQVRLRRSRRSVCLDVEDTGPGFGRMPAQSCRGLALTRGVVDSCHGVMEIHSGRSGGALVRLRLPLARTDVPA
jgi:signal transduction histidine kinase